MDKDRERSTRMEDLPVEAEQAAEVKGGLNFTRMVVDPNDKLVIDPNVKSLVDPNV
jgi:hypothetical protein